MNDIFQLIRMTIKQAEQVAKALSDPYRLQIIKRASQSNKEDPLSFSAITALFNLSPPAISHHVKQLIEAGLLTAEKKGRSNHFAINNVVLGNYLAYLMDTFL